MADENTSTVVESASTSAPTEPVESTSTQTESQPSAPAPTEDAWDFSNVEQSEAGKQPDAEKPAEPAKAEGEKQEEGEKSLADQVLEEAFSDDAEKSESEKESDLDKQDPQAMIAAQRNATARAWAERNAKKAEIIKDFQHDKPIAEVAARLEEINPVRYVELSQHAAHKLVDANPDSTFQRAYAVKMLQQNPNWDISTAKIPTLDELIANGAGTKETAQTQTPSVPADLVELTSELDKELNWDWRNPELDDNFADERELAMAKTIRALEAKAQAESGQSKELAEKLKGLAEGNQSTEQKEIKADLTKTVNEYRTEIENKILPYIRKNTGLEVTANDTPEIKAFKENRMKLYTGTDYERANSIPSPFESFAYNESSVRNELETITERVVMAQLKEVQAKRAGNSSDADKYHREAADEMVPMFQLMGQANKEFKALYIEPDMALIGKLSSKLAEPIKEASERIEVVSNGSGNGAMKPQQKDYETADDVWGGMVTDAAEEEKLRASA